MEEIIRRRHPNSMPALIYAASAVPGQNKVYESVDAAAGSQDNNKVTVFLEKRVKTLERELEERDEENGRKIRTIEQQYNAMSLRYEDHIKQLESKLTETSATSKQVKEIYQMQEELSRQKEEYEKIVGTLRDRLLKKEAVGVEDIDDSGDNYYEEPVKLSKSHKNTKKNINNKNNKSDLNHLRSQLSSKQSEVEDLKSTVHHLQREREQMLSINQAVIASRNVTVSRPKQLQKNNGLDDDALTRLEEVTKKCQYLEKENNNLHKKVEVRI